MATNDILQFATDNTNVLTQAEYVADGQRTSGNVPGVARSKLVNKAARQASTISAGVGQFMADNQATNITDTLTPAAISTAMTSAVRAAIPTATESTSGKLPVATQAQTDAGTDDATIVTPKKLRWGFSVSLGTSGYIVFPSWMGGLIIQWITDSTTLAANTGRSITLPLAFPTSVYSYVVSARNGSVAGAGVMSAVTVGNTGISVYNNGSVAVAGAQTFLIGK